MPTRVRSRSQHEGYRYPSYFSGTRPSRLPESSLSFYSKLIENRQPSFKVYGETQTTHYKTYGAYHYVQWSSGSIDERVLYTNEVIPEDHIFYLHDCMRSLQLEGKLNWSKLPTSSEYNLIMFLAEIDESILSLLNVFKDMSVGNFSYGVLPFIGELQAIGESFKKAVTWDGSYEDTQSFTWERSYAFPAWGQYRHISIDGKFIQRGKVYWPEGTEINRVFDWIGLHPDLATCWDLVPLSFLVNYIIPVGKFLEEFRQGGWMKAIYIDGWESVKATIKETRSPYPGSTVTVAEYSPWTEYYRRSKIARVLQVPEPFDRWDPLRDWTDIAKAFTTFAAKDLKIR